MSKTDWCSLERHVELRLAVGRAPDRGLVGNHLGEQQYAGRSGRRQCAMALSTAVTIGCGLPSAENVLLAGHYLARRHSEMNLTPSLGHVWECLVDQ
jgi:hypothetical protein